MLLGSKIVGPAQKIEIVAGTIAADIVHQFDETQVEDALSRWIRGLLAFGAHGTIIVRRKMRRN